ncbi:hypothetical protein, partial [uncultured Bacteroides sp.]|uniref:hypothetical protein n=1 Tax=uncultured Bacteroides sp. TaxID=162156 RepID=UPI002630528E
SFPKAGAKVAGFRIHAKHTRDFFSIFHELFHKALVYSYVLRQVFEGKKGGGKERTPNYINAGARKRKTGK